MKFRTRFKSPHRKWPNAHSIRVMGPVLGIRRQLILIIAWIDSMSRNLKSRVAGFPMIGTLDDNHSAGIKPEAVKSVAQKCILPKSVRGMGKTIYAAISVSSINSFRSIPCNELIKFSRPPIRTLSTELFTPLPMQ
jgi:hypothetical protein